MKRRNDWKPVVKSLLKRVLAEGLELQSVNDGEEIIRVNDIDKATEHVCAVDEARINFKKPQGGATWIYIVLGNGPEEIACDYGSCPELDKATGDHYIAWDRKPVPLEGEMPTMDEDLKELVEKLLYSADNTGCEHNPDDPDSIPLTVVDERHVHALQQYLNKYNLSQKA